MTEPGLPGVLVADDRDPARLGARVLAALRAGPDGDGPGAVAVLDGRWPTATQAAAREALARHAGQLAPDDLVVFTSGSSGTPRAVHRSLASWQASAPALTELLALRPEDLTWLPGHPASTLSLYAAWHADDAGTQVRYADDPHADATIVHAAPSLLPAVLRARDEGRLPALRLVVTAGDRVPTAVFGECAARGLRLLAYYGAAELSFVGIGGSAGDEAGEGSAVASYRAFPGVQVDIRDGLLWSRSDYQAFGYLGDAPRSETAAGAGTPAGGHGSSADGSPPRRTGPLRRAAGGWASVGDAARWVGPGRFEILGRADGAVTVAGHTILLEEVEDALRAHPRIEDALVVGCPDPVHGARLVALWVDARPCASEPAGRGPSAPDGIDAIDALDALDSLDARAALDSAAPSDGRGVGTPPEGVATILSALPVPARPRAWIRVGSATGLPRTPSGKPDRGAAALVALATFAPTAHEGRAT